MINAIKGLFLFLSLIFCIWFILFAIPNVEKEESRKKSESEALFKSACVAVNGNAVFNGKNWECLK